MATKYYLLAPLQNFFTDATGNPLVGGYLYSYKATDHATAKNIAKVENPASAADYYTNPLELDASGSVPVPYALYFADDELYYIVLTNSDQNPLNPPDPANVIRTWDDFGVQQDHHPVVEEVDYTNYILNSQYRFWRKQSYAQADIATLSTLQYIADTGWFFTRNNNSGDVAISFGLFIPGQTDVPNNPLYYLNFVGSTIGSGETIKDVIFKIDDVTAFAGEQIQIAFYGKSSLSDLAELVIIQHFGTSPEVQILNNVQFTTDWTQLTFDITLPSITGKSINASDNYLEIGIRAPLNKVANFSITNWQLNRGETLLEYNYQTKEIEQSTQRTYQLPFATDNDFRLPIFWNGSEYEFDDSEVGRISIYMTDSEMGYLACDGSTYSTLDYITESNSKLKYSRLYDKWDNGCSTGLTTEWFVKDGNAFGFGPDGFFPSANWDHNFVFYNTKEKTNVTTWTDNNTTFTFSKVLTGSDLLFDADCGIEYRHKDVWWIAGVHLNNYTVVVTNTNDGAVTAPTVGTLGTTVTLTIHQVGDATHPEIFYMQFNGLPSTPANYTGKYFLCSSTSADHYVWYKVDGVGTDPAVGGRTGILVELSSWHLTAHIAYLTRNALRGMTAHQVTFVAASMLTGGEYCNVYNSTIHYVPYITIDGVGTDPKVSGTTSIEVALSSTDVENDVRDKFAKALKKIFFQVPDLRGLAIRGTDYTRGIALDESTLRYLRGDFSYKLPGSVEGDQFAQHAHSYQEPQISIQHGTGAIAAADVISGDTGGTGGSETRMVNMYVNFFVKY